MTGNRKNNAVPQPEAPGESSVLAIFGHTLRKLIGPGRGVVLLEIATALYVTPHFLIFLFAWLRPTIAWPLGAAYIAFFAYASWHAILWARRQAAEGQDDALPQGDAILAKKCVGLLLIAAGITACTGVGGLTYQFFDYFTYDMVLRGMVEYPWRAGFYISPDDPDLKVVPTYYYGYFLPSALIARAVGWETAYLFQYFWNSYGVLLTVIWFMRIVGIFQLRYALLFLCFGSVDLIGYIVTTPLPDGAQLGWWDYITGTFWWSIGPGWMAHWTANFSLLTPEGLEIAGGVFYRFYGPLSFLFDGPLHVLPGWVLLLMGLHDVIRRGTMHRLPFLTAMLPICSVFITMGSVPIVVISAIFTRFRGLLSVGNIIIGPPILFIFMFYYQSVEAEIISGFLWNFQRLSDTWFYLAIYYVSAFLLYAAVAPSMRGNGYRPGRLWFYGALLVFLLAPWYRLGIFNDFSTKVVIPSQLVFLICLATSLREPEGKFAMFRQRLLILLLIVGAWSAIGIVHRAVAFGFSFSPPPFERVRHPAEHIIDQHEDQTLYFHDDNVFWKYLARPHEFFSELPPNPVILELDFATLGMDLEAWEFYSENLVQSEEGLAIRMQPGSPLIRNLHLRLNTNEVGHITLDHSVVDAEGNTPDYRLVFLWASGDDLARHGDRWPFHRWQSAMLWPEDARVTANPYWRGTVTQFAIYFDAAGPRDIEYEITLRRLTFTER